VRSRPASLLHSRLNAGDPQTDDGCESRVRQSPLSASHSGTPVNLLERNHHLVGADLDDLILQHDDIATIPVRRQHVSPHRLKAVLVRDLNAVVLDAAMRVVRIMPVV
jgi:hypothetical protein